MRESRFGPDPVVAAWAVIIPTAKVTKMPATIRVREGTMEREITKMVLAPTTITVGMVTVVYVTIMPFVLVIVPIKEAGLLVSSRRPDSLVRISLLDKDITTSRFITTTGVPVFTTFLEGVGKLDPIMVGVPVKWVIRAEEELAAVIAAVRVVINRVCSVPWATDTLAVVRGVTVKTVLLVEGLEGV